MDVLVTGGTGYLGRALLPRLVSAGHRVRALVRPGSEGKLAAGCEPIAGSALDAGDVEKSLQPGDTIVHLVGVPHPSPRKAAEFERVDAGSVAALLAAVRNRAARGERMKHLVYLSVAHPAPAMRVYWSVRERCEARIAENGVPATFLRPWYVLGPGHRWPVVLLPLYALARIVPAWRGGARRLGLVRLREMVGALEWAIAEPPASGVRILEVDAIRRRRAARMPPPLNRALR